MNNKWIFRDGFQQTEWGTFPLAFSSMHNSVIKQQAGGKKFTDITRNMVIIAPTKNAYGDFRHYTYDEASKMAELQGFLIDGRINKKAMTESPRFKIKQF